MLRYFLTLLPALSLAVAVSISPRYWGALEDKRLSGPVLAGFLLSAVAILAIFRQLQENCPQNAPPKQVLKQFVWYIAQYGSFILLFCMAAWLVSLGTHWLLAPFLSEKIINGLSFFFFWCFVIGLIALTRR
jgi:hypothetical protein